VAFPLRSAAEESITVAQFRSLSLRLTGAGLSDHDVARALGSDPKQSVVDRNLRTHNHPNLFFLGSAMFPTYATANPTLTIAALSLRAVDEVKATLTQ